MRVKLVNCNGEEYLLPEEMSVQGYPDSTTLPGIEIAGRPGKIIDRPLTRMESREILVGGTIAGIDKDEADKIREEIAAFINRSNPLRLYRHETADRYITAYKRNMNHAYHVGHYGGRLFTLSITLEATDPFFYAENVQNVLQSVSNSGAVWTVNQPGTVDKQQPIIFIKARSGVLVNPKLTMGEYSIDCQESVYNNLVLNCEQRIAILTDGNLDYYLQKWGIKQDGSPISPTYETNVINNILGNWILYGFPLDSGDNQITYTDDVASSHNADISIVWRPQYY